MAGPELSAAGAELSAAGPEQSAAGPEVNAAGQCAAVGRAWATALGCDPGLLGEPGAHLVPGGAQLRGFAGVYLASIGPAVLVYCPSGLRGGAAEVLAATPAGELFTARTCAALGRSSGVVPPSMPGHAVASSAG
jgi:hypothetical protein